MMTTGLSDKEREHPPTPEELAAAEEVRQIILSLDKTSRAQRLYLPNNQILVKHKAELAEKLRQFLEKNPQLDLRIGTDDLYFNEISVYHNSNKKESFAFHLYSDGVRQLSFLEGLGEEELLGFTAILGREGDEAQLEGDLVTALWEKEFPHIRYTVADSILEEPPEEGEKTPDEQIDEMLAIDAEEMHPDAKSGAPQTGAEEMLELVKASAHFGQIFQRKSVLAEEELSRIKRDIEFCERPDKLLNDFIDILFDILKQEESPDDFGKLGEVLLDVVGNLAGNGLIYLCAEFCQRLRQLCVTPIKLPAPHVEERVNRVMEQLSTKERVENYIQIVNQGYRNSADDLTRFICALQPTAVKPFLDNLPLVVDTNQRQAICRALAELCPGDASFFAPYLHRKDPQFLADILHLLSHRKDEGISRVIAPLVKHEDRGVRREVISALRNFNDGRSLTALFSALDDEAADNRTLALRILAARREPEILSRLTEYIQGDGFLSRDLQEKKSALYALAKAGADNAIAVIGDLLHRKSWFKKEAQEEVYQCAIFALASIGSEAALKALQQEAEGGNKAVQKYAQQAVRKILQQRRDAAEREGR